MLLYVNRKNLPPVVVPDGSVVIATPSVLAASKSVENNLLYVDGGPVYRFTDGAYVQDSTRPDNSLGWPSVSPDGKFITSSLYGTRMSYCWTSKWTGSAWSSCVADYAGASGSCGITRLSDSLAVEHQNAQPVKLKHGTAEPYTREPISTVQNAPSGMRMSLDASVIVSGSYREQATILVKSSAGKWLEFASGSVSTGWPSIDVTADGSLIVFGAGETGSYKVRVMQRVGDTVSLLAELPSYSCVSISNDGTVLAGLNPGKPLDFYRRTATATWQLYRTAPAADIAATLLNGIASCVVDPAGRFAMASTTRGVVLYHT